VVAAAAAAAAAQRQRRRPPGAAVPRAASLLDMSASLAAKVAVSPAEQADPAALAAAYDAMAAKFASGGLDLRAVAATAQYYDAAPEGEDAGPAAAPPRPLAYTELAAPLPEGAVRLSVVLLQRSAPALAAAAAAAAREVAAALPAGTRVHLSDPRTYHITVHSTSQPHTPRPDPFDPGAALPAGLPPAALAAAARPSAAALRREEAAVRAAAAATPPPRLAVHRLLLADSGTLLLVSVDASGAVAALRGRLRAAFPGAPPRQSTICHVSLGRVLSPRQLAPANVAAVQRLCDAWTARLRGAGFEARRLHHVHEATFASVDGPRVGLPFQGCEGDGEEAEDGGPAAEELGSACL
jgi:hypothetical protein